MRSLLYLVMLLLLGGCLATKPPSASRVTLEEKIGQMLMVGFRGLQVREPAPILRDIRDHHLGGVILFDYDASLQSPLRNIASPGQLRELTAALQEASAVPLLVAVDQEGGQVARLREDSGFPPSPSAASLGADNDQQHTYREALIMAETLAEAGINLNLAPVVDLAVNPDNPVIAGRERSYSADPAVVVAHARAFIAAHHARGVLCALKHFPGHGSSRDDSHLGLVDVTATWTERELEPYRQLLGEADAVMTAHVFNARLDMEYPATLSRATIDGLLREKLGYPGVVISDDLQMGAITTHFGRERALREALNAGVDILLIANNSVYEEKAVADSLALIRGLVERGEVPEARIDAAYRRIMQLKSRLTAKTR